MQHLTVAGALRTAGDRLTTLEVAGHIHECALAGGVHATGIGSQSIEVSDTGSLEQYRRGSGVRGGAVGA